MKRGKIGENSPFLRAHYHKQYIFQTSLSMYIPCDADVGDPDTLGGAVLIVVVVVGAAALKAVKARLKLFPTRTNRPGQRGNV